MICFDFWILNSLQTQCIEEKKEFVEVKGEVSVNNTTETTSLKLDNSGKDIIIYYNKKLTSDETKEILENYSIINGITYKVCLIDITDKIKIKELNGVH